MIKILPANLNSFHKTGQLNNLSKADITKKLGMPPTDFGPDGDDGKVLHEWTFTADGVECAIWDWKGSSYGRQHSTFGPNQVFAVLFGTDYSIYA